MYIFIVLFLKLGGFVVVFFFFYSIVKWIYGLKSNLTWCCQHVHFKQPEEWLNVNGFLNKGKGLVIDDMIARIITYSYYLCWLWVLLVEIGLKTFSLADLAYKMYEVVYNWVQSC